MKFYKDYHFYIAISAFIILIIGLLTNYFNLFVDAEMVTTVISYVLSFLIAFNVISINVNKEKTSDEIKQDINNALEIINDSAEDLLQIENLTGNKNGEEIEQKSKDSTKINNKSKNKK